VEQAHATDMVIKGLKELTVVMTETNGDGEITGASVQMCDRGERCLLPPRYSPGAGRWNERLVQMIKAVGIGEDKEKVRPSKYTIHLRPANSMCRFPPTL